jgi:hypothetical protein
MNGKARPDSLAQPTLLRRGLIRGGTVLQTSHAFWQWMSDLRLGKKHAIYIHKPLDSGLINFGKAQKEFHERRD